MKALGLLAAILFLAVSPVRAQGEIQIDSLQIELWPEFDQPSVLVILSGRLPSSTELPAELTLRVPAVSGGPSAVAVMDSQGALINAPFEATAAGNDIAVTFTVDAPNFHMEYYDPTLTRDGTSRTYRFQWAADYPINRVEMRLQEPKGAEGFTSDPVADSTVLGEYGLTYLTLAFGKLDPGQTITLNLDYSKSSTELTSDAVGATSPLPVEPLTPEPANALTPWLIPIGAAGLLLLGVGAVWYLRSMQADPARHGRPRRHRRSKGKGLARSDDDPLEPADPSIPSASHEADGFCTHCGQPLAYGDRFCRRCGIAIKSPN